MRAFIALELPREFASETAGLSRALSSKIKGRFMPRENLHVTLAFLGDINEAQASEAITALDAVSRRIRPVRIHHAGLGKFGKKSDATLWLGVGPEDELSRLALLIREELSARELPFDDKSFVAHITLARRANVTSTDFQALPFPNPAQVSRITLFKSELSQDGATYKPLYSIEC